MRILGVNAVDHPWRRGDRAAAPRRAPRAAWHEVTLTSPSGDGPLTKAGFPTSSWTSAAWAGRGRPCCRVLAASAPLSRDFDLVYLNGTVCGRLLPALRAAATVLHVHDIVDRIPATGAAPTSCSPTRRPWPSVSTACDAHVVYCPVELDPPQSPAPWRPARPAPSSASSAGSSRARAPLDLVAAAPADPRRRSRGPDRHRRRRPLRERSRICRGGARGRAGSSTCRGSPTRAGVMRHLDVLVAPSLQEPFGTVLSEAMAVGTPVVATRVGGLPRSWTTA